MRSPWAEWIHAILKDDEDDGDDSLVELLRRRIAGGEVVVRVNLPPPASGAIPTYRVVLANGSRLSQVDVPHSESFTRWSLQTGTRMATIPEEISRVAIVLGEGLRSMETELGPTYLHPLLVYVIRAFGAPRATRLLADRREAEPTRDRTWARTAGRLNDLLSGLTKSLARQLHYSEEETADILDAALEKFVAETFHLPPAPAGRPTASKS